MSEKWDPSYPEFANRPAGSGLNEKDNSDSYTVKGVDGQYRPMEWFAAPSDSHLDSFALESTDTKSPYFSRLRKINGRSALHVKFKTSGKAQKTTHYLYLYDSPALAAEHFQLLKDSQHPGEIVHHVLIAQKIPYERVH